MSGRPGGAPRSSAGARRDRPRQRCGGAGPRNIARKAMRGGRRAQVCWGGYWQPGGPRGWCNEGLGVLGALSDGGDTCTTTATVVMSRSAGSSPRAVGARASCVSCWRPNGCGGPCEPARRRPPCDGAVEGDRFRLGVEQVWGRGGERCLRAGWVCSASSECRIGYD